MSDCRRQHYLVSLVLLALLTMAPANLRAESTSLTPDLLNKLLDLDARKGTDREAAAPIANALGLTASGQAWPIREIATPDAETPSVLHGFAVNRGAARDIIVTRRNPDKIRVFRAQRDGVVVSAMIFDLQTRQATIRVPAEAQAELDAEFTHWAGAFGHK